MAAITQSSVSGILKELYDNQKVAWMTFKDNPIMAMMHKETKFPGKYFPLPVVYGLSNGASATYSYADANQSSPLVAEFLVTRVSDFSLATIDGQLLAAATTDPGSFIDGSELMIDAAWQQAVNRQASAMYRNGAGTIAQISSVTLASAGVYTVVLSNRDDNVQFGVGQTIVAVQNIDGSGTAPTDVAVVSAVIRSGPNAGTLTVTSSTNLVADWPTTYYLATQGDLPTLANNNFQPSTSATTNSLVKMAGLAAWLPIATPGNTDSFFSVNRSLDPTRLAGTNFNASGLSLEEGMLQGTSQIAMQGGRVDTAVCSYATYTALIISLGSKLVYVDEKVGEIGFRGVQVNGANSVINVFPDRSCPDGFIYAIELDDWTLRSQNESVHILKYLDEIEILRVPGQDSAQLRVGGYFNMYPRHPGHNGAIQVQLQTF